MHRANTKGAPFVWSPEEEALVLDLIHQKVPLMDIGKRFGCGYKPIKRIANLHNIVFYQGSYEKRVSDEVRSSILDLLSSGKTLSETAALLGRSKRSIEKVAHRHKVKVTRKPRDNHFDAQTEHEIIALIQERLSLEVIAKRYKCNPDTLSRVAKRHGIKPNAPRPGKSRYISQDYAVAMAEAYKAGATLDDLSTQYRASVPVIRRTLTKQGVSIRLRVTSKTIEDAIIHDYVHGGLTIAHITDKHRVTDKVVTRLIKERQLVRVIAAKPRPSSRQGSFYDGWVKRYGKEGADRRREEHRALCSKNASGSKNPMFGKPTPQGSGNGWKGWYRGHFFRSLRELTFMLEMEERGVQWVNGEKGAYRVRYVDPNGSERTYAPDYVVLGEAMYEIKPKRLWASPLVTAKRLAAEVLCSKLGIEYRLVDPKLDGEKLKALHEKGGIKWWGQCEAKFLAYYDLAA